jgi:catechol 2,3-dioxygenase-like lactoylglutathione lyase family enzyme
MKLEFLYTPTRDLQASLGLYRDELGWEEAWREGDSTVTSEPQEIPGGYLATFEDPSGNTIYVMDQSLDAGGSADD